jgi:hypothetical protein
MTIGDYQNAKTAQSKNCQYSKVRKINECTPIRDDS